MSSSTAGVLSYHGEILEQPIWPTSYSICALPPKSILRKRGYNIAEINTNTTRDHPLATWKSYGLKKGTTYRAALTLLEETNQKTFGLLKARIIFSDGSQQLYARTDPNVSSSFRNIGEYNPNGVFKATTGTLAASQRAALLPRLKPVTNTNGHSVSPAIDAVKKSTFAPEVLFHDCPPPLHSQFGFDFTPVSTVSFLLKPNDPAPGVRDVQSNFTHRANDFRPRAFLRDETGRTVNSRHCHCAEVFQVGDYTMDLGKAAETVNHRNRRVAHNYTSTGSLKANSTIVGKRHMAVPMLSCSHREGTATTKQVPHAAADAVEPRENNAAGS